MDTAGHFRNVHVPATAAEFHHAPGGQAVNGRRPLKGHADAQAGALVHGRVRNVLAIEDNAAAGDLVAGKAHDGHEQGGFARAVGTEEDKGFAGFDGQVYAVQNGCTLHRNMQIANLEHVFPQR